MEASKATGYQESIISMVKHLDNPSSLERIYNLTSYLYLGNKKAVPSAPTLGTVKTNELLCSMFKHIRQRGGCQV